MLNKRDAAKLVKEKLEHAAKLIAECEAIALESKIDFDFHTPGLSNRESFDGSGQDWSEDGSPTGWDHSQC